MENENENDRTLIVKKVVYAIMIVLILAYIVSVILKANFVQIKTETANIMTVADSISAKGYFIRDEKLVEYDGDGFISYTVEDGDKISKNESVANVFSNSEAASDKQKIKKLEAQKDKLVQLQKTSETISLTPDKLDKSIDTLLSQINKDICCASLSDADSSVEELLYHINERQLVTGKVSDFADKIERLTQEIDELKSSSENEKGKSVKAPSTGYFVSSADGYEEMYSTEDIKTLMPGDLAEDKLKKKSVGSGVIGKTIEGVYWYVACEVSGEEALKIKNADELQIELPLVNSEMISVELESVNQVTQTSDAIVVLKGNYMNKEMASVRYEDISVVTKTYTGIYVSKSAVHDCEVEKVTKDKKGKEKTETKVIKGVYILIGNELMLKEIIPLYTGGDYVICKQSPTDEELFSDDIGALKPHDDVVVEGANLYDGKIIDRTN